jgi:hypothetical protein
MGRASLELEGAESRQQLSSARAKCTIDPIVTCAKCLLPFGPIFVLSHFVPPYLVFQGAIVTALFGVALVYSSLASVLSSRN